MCSHEKCVYQRSFASLPDYATKLEFCGGTTRSLTQAACREVRTRCRFRVRSESNSAETRRKLERDLGAAVESNVSCLQKPRNIFDLNGFSALFCRDFRACARSSDSRLAAASTLLALSAGTFFIFSTQPQCSAVEHSHKFDSDII